MPDYFVYFLKCWNTKKAYKREIPKHGHIIYVGYTGNLINRFWQHITGKSTYTKRFHGNILLGYFELWETRKEAIQREGEFKNPHKKYGRDDKIKMMDELNTGIKKLVTRVNKKYAHKYRRN